MDHLLNTRQYVQYVVILKSPNVISNFRSISKTQHTKSSIEIHLSKYQQTTNYLFQKKSFTLTSTKTATKCQPLPFNLKTRHSLTCSLDFTAHCQIIVTSIHLSSYCNQHNLKFTDQAGHSKFLHLRSVTIHHLLKVTDTCNKQPFKLKV